MNKKYNSLNEAQVLLSQKKFGANVLPEPKSHSLLYFFIDVYRDKINMILIALLIFCLVVAVVSTGNYIEVFGIGFVLLLIGIIGAITKYRAQKHTFNFNKKMSVHYSQVFRDGILIRIDSRDIVVGDIVSLQIGEIIPADGYIINGAIGVNNSILNGESRECPKKPIKNYKYRERKFDSDDYVSKNLLFSGTSVVSGQGIMYVTRVGVKTENAKTLIAMRELVAPKTDLDIKLDNLANSISKFGFICAILIFCFMMWHNISLVGGFANYFAQDFITIFNQIMHVLTISLTVIVAAVPEGLPFIITIIIAQNATKMVKHNVLAKNTHKIPEAGNLHILCTDKTGTLTYGNMIPVGCYLGNGDAISFDDDTIAGRLLFNNIVLNNSARFDKNGRLIGGTVTQRALLNIVGAGYKYDEIIRQNKVVKNIPFNSTNKYSAVTVVEKKRTITYCSGAPEILLKNTSRYIDKNGKVHKLNKDTVNKILSQNTRQSKRMMAMCYCESGLNENALPINMILISLVALRDEFRKEVPASVRMVRNAGIQVIMITGDNIDTARSIAKDTGIVTQKSDIVINANELEKMSDKQIKEILPNIRVIARAVPSTKLRLVKIAQELNLCIGMCGDGTNDAPALKRADVGFAMGSGTDVCKQASDIIITDDNFVSIAEAILFGRTFIKNITKFLMFQLPINITLVFICLLYPIFVGTEALLAVQILIVNIVVDSLNSLAFGAMPPQKTYMKEQTKPKGVSLFNANLIYQLMFSIVTFLMIFSLTSTALFQNIFDGDINKNLAARFGLLMLLAVVNGFCVRTDNVNIFSGLSKNPMFIIMGIIIIGGAFAIINFGGPVFGGAQLNATQWGVLIIMSLLLIPFDVVRKILTGIK